MRCAMACVPASRVVEGSAGVSLANAVQCTRHMSLAEHVHAWNSMLLWQLPIRVHLHDVWNKRRVGLYTAMLQLQPAQGETEG